ncbi:hypothetical protein ABW19_dt0210551 [Dactylella cylindrospora]|nr:hypothetical protein ABW19_dt0210551 [Dactylella cylindrospora]
MSSISSIASSTMEAIASATSEAAAATSTHASSHSSRPPAYKAVGVALAVASGVFIGVSYVLKKKGLLQANLKDNAKPGEGVGYLKNAWWWTGMILMIVGEICNFAAYAFVDAILVTPLGALSVVITAILSSIFLKERLSFVGKAGCFVCVVGSVIIAINAPEQSAVSTIEDMKRYIIAPGFLSYAGVVIAGCIFIILWVGPRYGDKSMLVYLTVCSLIGGLSVVATQGLGAAVVAQAAGTPQFNNWFLYVLLIFVVATLLTEIYYLNKALNIFNAALVTPTYYVIFTSATIVTSAVLFQGFKGTGAQIATIVMGFLQICAGVVLLQLSKSAKEVPDTAVFRGDLDQVKIVAEQEEPESEPKADAIRGTAAIIRRMSTVRKQAETREMQQIHEDHLRDIREKDHLSPNVIVEWDGLRRRVSFADNNKTPGGRPRRNTSASQHTRNMGPTLTRLEEMEEGRVSSDMMRIATQQDDPRSSSEEDLEKDGTIFGKASKRAKDLFVQKSRSQGDLRETEPVPLDQLTLPDSVTHRKHKKKKSLTSSPEATPKKHTISLIPASPELPWFLGGRSRGDSSAEPPHMSLDDEKYVDDGTLRPETAGTQKARRQFSFQGMFSRLGREHHHQHQPVQQDDGTDEDPNVSPGHLTGTSTPQRPKQPSRHQSRDSSKPGSLTRIQTEEERLGLVTGDAPSAYEDDRSDHDYQNDLSFLDEKQRGSSSRSSTPASPTPPLQTYEGISRKPVGSARNSTHSLQQQLSQDKGWDAKQ